MNRNQESYQVAIIGGGPVGLYLACRLHQADISCIVLEKRAAAITHSRSIGIHPVSLELFDEIGLADAFISNGIKVKQGRAFVGDKLISTLSFAHCPPPFPYILTLPQYKTERLLAEHLNGLNPDILHRKCELKELEQVEGRNRLLVEESGKIKPLEAQFIVGCDGKDSTVRQLANIPFKGGAYDDTYMMGDFADNTSLGNDAGIFLSEDGVIESFPLSASTRRWVVKTKQFQQNIIRTDIESRIRRRIYHDLSGTQNSMLSSFGVQKKMASTMAKGSILLAGDAAHVISPIGGQGMNLGWLDARDLASSLQAIFYQQKHARKTLSRYSKQRLKIARKAARRAEFNMTLGRETSFLFIRKWLLRGILKTPLNRLMARLFTMRGLHTLPV